MSQTQQILAPPQNISPGEPTVSAVEPEVGSWEPYLGLMKSWQRADDICAKAIEQAESARQEEDKRVRNTFESDKSKLENAQRERVDTIEAERRFTKENADKLLGTIRAIQNRVRQAIGTVGLETLMNDMESSPFVERGDASTTLASLGDAVTNSMAVENSLQADLFDLRAARQRQSAQLWTVGVGLWIVAVLVFAPYISLSALLMGVAAFVIGTPRKVVPGEPLQPSFASHMGHCIALLFGMQQVMQHPFSLIGKNRNLSSNALGGAIVMAFIGWLVLLMFGVPAGYDPAELIKHLGFISLMSIFAGAVTFAIANNDVTLSELDEGNKNKILK